MTEDRANAVDHHLITSAPDASFAAGSVAVCEPGAVVAGHAGHAGHDCRPGAIAS
ncbi:uncharacterized protein SOCE836_054570 [Sorangium cellulosum]|uniref:Uncharacterized protein n=1 Tax=Sorangium cellulosum TaxID=56 RepID=A0A4V0NGI6_SORCE|nr:uncharacterized protein SOCE836_054570 [Sorangium cellulosum]WCQ92617.1 hypothetical protein NQZ70_05360 [Sorangium sp. Soce836]